tara:strand:- start:273 stop:2843 length:2571 start_codon:yes stop_codon:yes gene_type:complete
MTIALPYRRQQALGKNIQKAPTREQVKRVGPASDPGARGGPSNIPLGAFGGGEGLVDAGNAISTMGMNELAELQRINAKTETIQSENAVTNFNTVLGELNTTIFKDPTNGDVLDQFHAEGDAKLQEFLKKIKGSQRSEHYKQITSLKLTNALAVHNAATSKTVSDEQDKVIGFKLDTDLANQTRAPQNRADVIAMMQQNAKTIADYDKLLSYPLLQEKLRAADLAVMVYRSDKFFNAATPNFAEARRVLHEDSALGAMNQKFKLERLAMIDQAETKASLDTAKLKLESDKNRYVDLKNGKGLYDKVDGKFVPGTEGTDPKKFTHFTDKGAYTYNEETKAWTFDDTLAQTTDAGKDYKALVDSNLYNPEELKKYKHQLLTKDITGETEKELDRIKNSNYSDEMKKVLIAAHENRAAGIKEPELSPEVKGANAFKEKKAEEDAARDAYTFTPKVVLSDSLSGKINTMTDKHFETVVEGQIKAIHGMEAEINEVKEIFEDILLKGDPSNTDPKKQHLGPHAGLRLAIKTYNIRHPEAPLPERLTTIERFDRLLQPVNTIPEEPEEIKTQPEPDKIKTRAELTEEFEDEFQEMIASNDESQTMIDAKTSPLFLENLQAEARLQNVSMEKATGIHSGIQDFLAGTVAQIPGLQKFSNERVTRSRFLYSMIARDFVRFASLSPRYAVKEQELLQAIYPGPEFFNSPRQAMQRLQSFKSTLIQKLNKLRTSIEHDEISSKEEDEMFDVADIWVDMIGKINRFDVDFVAEPKSIEELSKMGKVKVNDYWTSLTDEEQIQATMDNPDMVDEITLIMESSGKGTAILPVKKQKKVKKVENKKNKTKGANKPKSSVIKQIEELEALK